MSCCESVAEARYFLSPAGITNNPYHQNEVLQNRAIEQKTQTELQKPAQPAHLARKAAAPGRSGGLGRFFEVHFYFSMGKSIPDFKNAPPSAPAAPQGFISSWLWGVWGAWGSKTKSIFKIAAVRCVLSLMYIGKKREKGKYSATRFFDYPQQRIIAWLSEK